MDVDAGDWGEPAIDRALGRVTRIARPGRRLDPPASRARACGERKARHPPPSPQGCRAPAPPGACAQLPH
eukprot:3646892-Pyramimonas_sp.AAC.1